MRIGAIPSIKPLEPVQPAGPSGPAQSVAQSFGQLLSDSVDQLNELQTQADALTQDLVAGKAENLHEVMLALQKASMALDFTIQVRNKVIEAYQEIMRTQV